MIDEPHGPEAKPNTHHASGTAFELFDGPDRLTFIKSPGPLFKVPFQKNPDRFRPHTQAKLRNNLLIAAFFLETANLGDFPANFWNTTPIPGGWVAFMITGGTTTLFMIYFAIWDAVLVWRNLKGLRAERDRLNAQKEDIQAQVSQDMVRAIDCFLSINLHEFWTLWVDRLMMDFLLGLGALFVGVGTLMAPAGANPKIFNASNILTGFLGNSFCAVYGLLNLGWAVYLVLRVRNHKAIAVQSLGDDGEIVTPMITKRGPQLLGYCVLNASVGLVAGGAALVTAIKWEAYTILVPCCLLSALIRWFWRRHLGYDRPLVYKLNPVGVNEGSLVEAINLTLALGQKVNSKDDIEMKAFPETSTFLEAMKQIAKHHLFEDFCLEVLKDEALANRLFPDSDKTVTIDWHALVSMVGNDADLIDRLLDVSRTILSGTEPTDSNYQRRWLLEAFGCYKAVDERGSRAPFWNKASVWPIQAFDAFTSLKTAPIGTEKTVCSSPRWDEATTSSFMSYVGMWFLNGFSHKKEVSGGIEAKDILSVSSSEASSVVSTPQINRFLG